MLKTLISIVLTLAIAFAAFGVQKLEPRPEDVTTGATAPNNWNIQTDQVAWTAIANAPDLFGRAATGVLGNYMYCFGEQNSNLARALNLTTELWEIPTLPLYGNCNWCGVTTDQHFYIVGRYSGAYGSEFQRFTPTAGGPTGTWALMASYPHAVCGAAADWDGGNFIYAAGGGSPDIMNAYKYDIANNTWTAIANLPVAMKYHGGSFVSGKFHVVGGYNTANAHYAYDPATNTWAALAAVPVAIYFSTFSITGNGVKLFSIGGGGGYGTWPATNAVQIYDPGTDTWSQETTLPLANGLNSADYVGGGISYSAGGYTGVFHNEAFKGTGFPVPYDPNSPGAVTNYTVSNNGATLMASLAWTNPTVTAGGATLTELTGIRIYRDGTMLTELTGVTIGGAMTHNDNTMTAPGMYGYTVVGYNTSGEGIPTSDGAWIGLDVPAAPTNVVATPVTDNDCIITWDAPTAGGHGGYWPAGSWTGQKVYRDGIEIADITGTNSSYTDTPPYQGTFTYSVSYYNASGEGNQGFAAPVFVPGAAVYEWEAITYNWVEINTIGSNSGITGDDQNLGPFPMGFTFPFYPGAGPFSDIRICSNGFLSFTSSSTAYSNATIPTAAEPNNLVAPYWDDLYPPGGGTVWIYSDVANNRWICEFENVAYFSGGGAATFEAILYDDGSVEYMYNNVANYSSCTIGIENQDGTEGVLLWYNGTGVWTPANQSGVRIYHPAVSDLVVTLTPRNPPIQIPPGGGVFVFDASIENTTTNPITFDAWTEARLPNGSIYGPLIMRTGLPIAPGQTIMRVVSQNVPSIAPPGNYTYIGNAGTHPGTVIDSDDFDFAKLAGDGAPNHNQGWAVCGWFGDETSLSTVVTRFELSEACPNPFNPSTTINFAIPQTSNVKLAVFDVNGREVAVIVDGMMPAGKYNAQFDGTGLASGIYFAKLTAGDFTSVKKLVLVK